MEFIFYTPIVYILTLVCLIIKSDNKLKTVAVNLTITAFYTVICLIMILYFITGFDRFFWFFIIFILVGIHSIINTMVIISKYINNNS